MKKLFSSILLLLSATSLKAMEQSAPKTDYWYTKVGAATWNGKITVPTVALGRHFENEHFAFELGLNASPGVEASQLWYFSKPIQTNRFYLGIGEQFTFNPFYGVSLDYFMFSGVAGWRTQIGNCYQFVEFRAGTFPLPRREGDFFGGILKFVPSISYGISF